MQLLGCTYQNIGPFASKTLTFGFPQGSMLIKAPIGTGKSFLFFDGPVYGLYKYSSRAMLSATASQGLIQICFEMNDQVYLVSRVLKTGKTKETCVSTLYTIDVPIQKINECLDQGQDFFLTKSLEEYFKKAGIHLEAFQFKNETDVQQHLDQLLPPREVILSTHILLQDAPNIFELPPAEKINVFKHVFGLLGIDEAKELLADEKRDIQTLLKAHSHTARFDDLLKQYLQQLSEGYRRLKNFKRSLGLVAPYQSFFDDLALVDSNVTIQNFSLAELDPAIISQVLDEADKVTKEYHRLAGTLQQQTLQLQELHHRQKHLQDTIITLEKALQDSQNTLKSYDPHRLEMLKKQSSSLLQSKVALDQQYEGGLQAIYQQIQERISQGKEYAVHIQHQEQQLLQLQQEIKKSETQLQDLAWAEGTTAHQELKQAQELFVRQLLQQIEQTKRYHSSLQEKKEFFDRQEKHLIDTIEELKKNISQALRFHCEKIQGECPFINHINERSLKQLHQQIEATDHQLQEVRKQFKSDDFEQHWKESLDQLQGFEKKYSELQLLKPEQWDSILPDFFAQHHSRVVLIQQTLQEQSLKIQSLQQDTTYQRLRDELKILIQRYDWKLIQSQKQEYDIIMKQLQEIDTQILQGEAQYQRYELLQKELITIQAQYVETQNNFAQLGEQIMLQESQSHLLEKQLSEFDIENLEFCIQTAQQFQKVLLSLHHLITEYKQLQLTILSLKEQEQMIGNLYQIFSKELMLLVLEESLPTLSEIINNFLSQVVEYTLSFELIKTSTDKLELDCLITDEKGVRSIKSLSGGQKVLLKITWILAISSYLRTSFLFLDETINNLDQDTVGKVAEMIKNFIQLHSLTFVVVTHSEQIQSLQLWDHIISLDTELQKI